MRSSIRVVLAAGLIAPASFGYIRISTSEVPWSQGQLYAMVFDDAGEGDAGCGGCDVCIHSEDPPGMIYYGHFTWDSETGRRKMGPNGRVHPETCEDPGYTCNDKHPIVEECGEEGGDPPHNIAAVIDEVWHAVKATDPVMLRNTIAAYPQYARVNRDRAAIQFVACSGAIVAHLPLSPEHSGLLD